MSGKLGLIRKIDFIQYGKLRCGKQLRGNKFYPYKNSCMQLADSSSLVTNGSIHFNCGKIGKSKAESYLRMDDHAQFIANGFFKIYYGCDIAIYNGAKLTVGSGFMNAGGQIRCGNDIRIGNNVAIGRNFLAQDGDFHTIIEENGTKLTNSAPIVIEDNVWIGANVMILKGVHIGEGAVIGAGTVVTKDVPAYSVIVGNPNRVLRTNIRWE